MVARELRSSDAREECSADGSFVRLIVGAIVGAVVACIVAAIVADRDMEKPLGPAAHSSADPRGDPVLALGSSSFRPLQRAFRLQRIEQSLDPRRYDLSPTATEGRLLEGQLQVRGEGVRLLPHSVGRRL